EPRGFTPVMYAAYAPTRASAGLTVGESAAIRVLKEASSADPATNSSVRRPPLSQGGETASTSNGTTANVLTPKRRERWKHILRSHTKKSRKFSRVNHELHQSLSSFFFRVKLRTARRVGVPQVPILTRSVRSTKRVA